MNNIKIDLNAGKKIYFASDFHLGAPNTKQSLEREHKIIRWLESIADDAAAIFLVGDIFDFWFEYKEVVPKGFIRFQGKIAELRGKNIPIYFFTGNHDMWMFGYFTEELGIPVFRKPQVLEVSGKKLYIAHGDGLGPGDHTYKFLKKLFENKICRWAFRQIHPDLGIRLAKAWSGKSRIQSTTSETDQFLGDDEWLWQYSKEVEEKTHHDFYVFGHRHLPIDQLVKNTSRYINLGEWVKYFTYGVFDGKVFELKKWEA